jgi:hypothetical protein
MTNYALRVNGYKEEDRMTTKGTKDTEVKDDGTHFLSILVLQEFNSKNSFCELCAFCGYIAILGMNGYPMANRLPRF